MRRVDPQQLLEEAPERVPGDIEREEPRRPDPEAMADVEQDADPDEVPDHLVEEGRVVGRAVEVLRQAVRDVDLQRPRQVGRLPVQLLVPPVAEPPDALREQQSRRDGVHEERDARARPAYDDRARDTPSPMPPHTPRPPLQTSTIPCHFGLGTSFHEVMSW